jgi:hypothetical protein
MKKNIAIISILFAAVSQNSFANGVEKTLPIDATNVKVSVVTLGSMMTSQTLISDDNEGPKYQNNYSPSLDVDVTYNSADQSEDATALSNGNDPQEVVVGGPTASFQLQITDAQAAAIKAKKLDPKSLVVISVAQKTVQFDNPVYTKSCIFSSDYNEPVNADTCIKHEKVSESRPVLTVDLK